MMFLNFVKLDTHRLHFQFWKNSKTSLEILLAYNHSVTSLVEFRSRDIQLDFIQNKANFENRHLVFLIFKKKQENDGVGNISSLFQRHCQMVWQCLWNKNEISPTRSFSCFFLNISNTRYLFSELVLFCIP